MLIPKSMSTSTRDHDCQRHPKGNYGHRYNGCRGITLKITAVTAS